MKSEENRKRFALDFINSYGEPVGCHGRQQRDPQRNDRTIPFTGAGDADALREAVKQQLITETEIDVALERLFTTRFCLGILGEKGEIEKGTYTVFIGGAQPDETTQRTEFEII